MLDLYLKHSMGTMLATDVCQYMRKLNAFLSTHMSSIGACTVVDREMLQVHMRQSLGIVRISDLVWHQHLCMAQNQESNSCLAYDPGSSQMFCTQ